jgi:molecular chaperone HscB
MNFNNFFDLFNLKPAVLVNTEKLDFAYQHLQKLCHPDLHHHDLDNNAAVVLSAKIAKAYDTLKKPLLCVDHLLYLKNCPPLNQSEKSIFDADILEENMEFQEKLEHLKEGDLYLVEAIEQKIEKTSKLLEKAFEENDTEQLQKQALYFFYRFQFLQKLKEKINKN